LIIHHKVISRIVSKKNVKTNQAVEIEIKAIRRMGRKKSTVGNAAKRAFSSALAKPDHK